MFNSTNSRTLLASLLGLGLTVAVGCDDKKKDDKPAAEIKKEAEKAGAEVKAEVKEAVEEVKEEVKEAADH